VTARLTVDFQAFYDRWHLRALTTWDLPEPRAAVVGVAGMLNELNHVSDYPTIQLPPFIRLPLRYPLHKLLHGDLGPHLAEWEAVQDQEHPGGLNYARWRRIFYLHVLRNVMLASRYRDRFHRRAGLLDEVFTDYLSQTCGKTTVQSIGKLRQWIDRRCPPRPTTPADEHRAQNG
jgi:hypothetical protein